ncbi:MAG: type II CAAX prenyl endopeptidase Rce1 family protein [Candidatus Heimdallarchaeota archaeon]
MNKRIKYTIIVFTFLMLTFPFYFGVFLDFFFVKEFNLLIVLIILFGYLILLIIGKTIELYGYNSKIIDIMEKHDVINSFIRDDNKLLRWLGFLVIMIIEELIFRYYLIGILFYQLYLEWLISILISSLIFAVYHLHTWFSYKNLRIVSIFLFYSFCLGLYTGYLLFTLGMISCIFAHYSLAIISYYGIYCRYFKKSRIDGG